jgi:hypothetical protein
MKQGSKLILISSRPEPDPEAWSELRRKLIGIAVLFASAFALGFFVSAAIHAVHNRELADKVTTLVRSCPQYVVVRLDGSMECRALMPRFSFDPWLHPELVPPKKPDATRG